MGGTDVVIDWGENGVEEFGERTVRGKLGSIVTG